MSWRAVIRLDLNTQDPARLWLILYCDDACQSHRICPVLLIRSSREATSIVAKCSRIPDLQQELRLLFLRKVLIPPAGRPRTDKFVVVGGHPGDPEYGCGGTIARRTPMSHKVTLLYMNDGAWETSAAVRIAEAKRACTILKAHSA